MQRLLVRVPGAIRKLLGNPTPLQGVLLQDQLLSTETSQGHVPRLPRLDIPLRSLRQSGWWTWRSSPRPCLVASCYLPRVRGSFFRTPVVLAISAGLHFRCRPSATGLAISSHCEALGSVPMMCRALILSVPRSCHDPPAWKWIHGGGQEPLGRPITATPPAPPDGLIAASSHAAAMPPRISTKYPSPNRNRCDAANTPHRSLFTMYLFFISIPPHSGVPFEKSCIAY
jgi:hypothetical protein